MSNPVSITAIAPSIEIDVGMAKDLQRFIITPAMSQPRQ
jgi:hypothetical protein